MQGEIRLSFAASHPAFAGHFPGRPIVPGVLLLDAAIHAIVQARDGTAGGSAIGQVSSVKFLSPVTPDESLTLSWRDTGQGQIRFDLAGSDRQVATGVLGWAPP